MTSATRDTALAMWKLFENTFCMNPAYAAMPKMVIVYVIVSSRSIMTPANWNHFRGSGAHEIENNDSFLCSVLVVSFLRAARWGAYSLHSSWSVFHPSRPPVTYSGLWRPEHVSPDLPSAPVGLHTQIGGRTLFRPKSFKVLFKVEA